MNERVRSLKVKPERESLSRSAKQNINYKEKFKKKVLFSSCKKEFKSFESEEKRFVLYFFIFLNLNNLFAEILKNFNYKPFESKLVHFDKTYPGETLPLRSKI